MKLYRNAAILVVVLALAFGAYWIIKEKKAAEKPAADTTKTIKVTDYAEDKVSQISVENADGTFVLEKKDKEWVLVSPTDIKADASKLSGIVTNSISVIADKVVEENPKNLALYGLDKPSTITVKLKEGGDKVLLLGSQTPTKGGYYAMVKGENKVYVVDSYTAEKLLFKKNDIRDTALYTLKAEDIITLGMDRAGSNIFKSKKLNGTDWSITAPIEGTANANSIQPMLTALAGVTAKEFIEQNPSDLSKYGLDKPAYVMDFATSSKSYKLLFGTEKTKGSEIYAKLDGSSEVFTIGTTSFTFLDKPFKEIIDTFVYIVNIDKVSKIELTMDGKTTTFGIDVYKDKDGKTDTDKDKFTVDGKDASGKDKDDKQPFRNFYQDLVGIGLDQVEPNAVVPNTAPEISILYYLKEAPGTMKVDFVSKDADYYYVLKNGRYTGMLVAKNNDSFGIQSMKAGYKTLMDFLAKAK